MFSLPVRADSKPSEVGDQTRYERIMQNSDTTEWRYTVFHREGSRLPVVHERNVRIQLHRQPNRADGISGDTTYHVARVP